MRRRGAREQLQARITERAETGRPLDEDLDHTLWLMGCAIMELYERLDAITQPIVVPSEPAKFELVERDPPTHPRDQLPF